MGRKDRHHGSPVHALCFLRDGHLDTSMYPLEPGRMKQAGRAEGGRFHMLAKNSRVLVGR